jgi:hypothetical protein
MKNIHILPTDKPSANILLKKDDGTFQIFDTTFYNIWKAHQEFGDFSPSNATYQNIYITSNEEIKEGNWYLDNLVHPNLISYPLQHSGVLYTNKSIIQSTTGTTSPISTSSKIILTTEQSLIKDGVQPIDDEFLEWFIKNPSCEEVKVEKFEDGDCEIGSREYINYSYEIIIPKEEPKQETLEEAAEKYCLINNIPTDQMIVKTDRSCEFETPVTMFIKGAKWQQERSYSEEEVLTIVGDCDGSVVQAKKWFEQFKKK